MAAGHGDPKKVVLAALIGNALISIAKFVAAFFSGSIAMVAEGVHSVADTTNQALLLLGMNLSKKRDPVRYPMGRAKESYFWAFVVSLMLFLLGGLYAIMEGIKELRSDDHSVGPITVPVIVLSVSIVFEGSSFYVALREFRKSKKGRSTFDALFRGRDPTIPVVLLEDTGAMLGLVIALVSVIVSWATGNSVADGIGSLLIGVLLCVIGIALALETHSLIIGEGVTQESRKKVVDAIDSTPGVDATTQLLSLHMGPDTVLLAVKVRFDAGSTLADVERVTDDLESRVRAACPEMKKIFVEADGDYDARLDPASVAPPDAP